VAAWQGIIEDFLKKDPGLDRDKFRLIPNGYDPADLEGIVPMRNQRFTIVYTGSMYGVRRPDTLLAAAAGLRRQGRIDPERVRLRFVGRFGEEVRAAFRNPEVRDMVEEMGYRPHAVSVAEIKGAHALLLVVDDYPGNEGIVPGKVFEYIGARRPVLALAPEGAVAELVRSTGAGDVLALDDVEGTAEAVHRLYREWETTGGTAFRGVEAVVERLSRRERARNLAALFDEVTERHGQET
jgi:glycosyltransferase involved in cell wall biosynthesis